MMLKRVLKKKKKKEKKMINLEEHKKYFKNHIATFTDLGNIKILDFKNPESIDYQIRFLFEEDYYRLHISGDLGELIASNYTNMRYEKFGDFVNNIEYFKRKIDCHSRPIYVYDEEESEKDLKDLIEEYSLIEELEERYPECSTEEEVIDDFIDDALENFSDEKGLSENGYELVGEFIPDFYESVEYIGRKQTGILELYMLAFKLAKEQLDKEKTKNEKNER